ncbi:MAG: phosphoserine transaminase [Actinobacteria bacterium]|nr:phosphoserine transaminase [Actinomycetota bacterium]
MNQIPNITLPPDKLPDDGRFGAGPSKIRTAQIEALVGVSRTLLGTSHRQKPVKTQVARLKNGLLELFQAPVGYEVVLGNGGSTAFWDIATFGLVRDVAQMLAFGEFGSKFVSSVKAAPFLPSPDVIRSEPGDAPKFDAKAHIDTYCTPHNETSTGVAIKPYRPVGADTRSLLVVDATSAAGGLDVEISEVDAYYFSPQKCFGSDGGLFVALLSPAAIARAEEIKATGRYIPPFLDLVSAIENSRLDQTINTPAIATLFMMAEQVDWFNSKGGMAWTTARTTESANILYSWAEASPYATPFVTDPAKRSNVVVTIDFAASIDATVIAAILRKNGIVDVEPYRKLGRNQLRVSVFPAVEPTDIVKLTRSIDAVISALS